MISVIIPTIHQLDLVQQCVTSYRETVQDLPSEIIVVDDGSSPDIQQALKEWAAAEQVKLVLKPANEGFSKAINDGIRHASGQYTLFVNNDIIFQQPGWLHPMVQQFETAPEIGIVGARLLYPDNRIQHGGVYPSRNGWFDHRYRFQPADYPPALSIEDVSAVTGALMLVRNQVFQTIGLLSERYFIAYEDIDFCYRAKTHGWRIVYCGAASAVHLEGHTRGTTKMNKNPYYYRKEREARRLFWSIWKGAKL